MDCNDVLEQLGDYLDEDARDEICKAIKAHMAQCHNCRFEVDTLKQTIVLYQHEEEVDVPIAIRSSLQAALASEYKADSGTD